MTSETTDSLYRTNAYLRVALVTAGILLVPLVAMQFTEEVSWDGTDFIVMGILLSGLGSLFVLIASRAQRKYRTLIVVCLATLFLFLWAELAVGIFTDLGS